MSELLNQLQYAKEIAQELADRDAAKSSFACFVNYMTKDDPAFIPLSLFQIKLCELLQHAATTPNSYCMINVAFGHSKSTLANKLFPAWCMGRNPNLRIATVSHKHDIAQDFSRETRGYLNSQRFRNIFADVRLDPESDGAGRWRVQNHRGFYLAAGITAGIQGMRFDMIVFDDLLGSQEDAQSQTVRETRWRAMNVDFLSRLEPNGTSLMIASRMHIDDPPGRIIENMKKGGRAWQIFSFPAIAEVNDLLNRKPGDALWPEKFPIKKLLELKTSGQYSEREWSATFQQRPTPEGGSILKRQHWRIWGGNDKRGNPIIKLPPLEYVVMSVDTALKDKAQNDYNAVSLWGVFKPPEPDYTWSEKLQMIRESKNSPVDLGIEFGIPPKDIRRIQAGEFISQPRYDDFDMGYEGPREHILPRSAYNLMMIDAWHAKLPYPDLRRKIIAYYTEWKPDLVIIEDTTAGPPLQADLLEAGIASRPFKVGRADKVTRAHLISGVFEQGLVYAIGQAVRSSGKVVFRSDKDFSPSSELMVAECEVFPSGLHDDLVDTLVNAVHYLRFVHTFKLDEDMDDEERPKDNITKVKVELPA